MIAPNSVDREHDPGVAVARDRASRLVLARDGATAVRSARGGSILVGTASWTDPTITSSDIFYPKGVTSAEDRLRFYATRFPLVEVDSTYYALPTRRMAELWLDRTPDDFTFNVKAHALMTGQPTEVKRLPKELRDELPAELAERSRIYAKDLPAELYDAVWAIFLDALEPLHSSGKLGAVLLQYPRWFIPTSANRDALVEAKERLGDVRGAVEFRNHRWFGDDRRQTERTLELLARHALPYVMIDGPQGLESSVPPVVAVTASSLALIRLHGRRVDLWEAKKVPTVERYRYLYAPEELERWVPEALGAAEQAKQTHVLFNNCYGNYGTTNALEFTEMLEQAVRGA